MSSNEIYVEPANLEGIICGVARLSEALQMDPYSFTVRGITGDGSTSERGRAAIDFIEKYYDLTAGALEVIAAATGIIAVGLANSDISIVARADRAEV